MGTAVAIGAYGEGFTSNSASATTDATATGTCVSRIPASLYSAAAALVALLLVIVGFEFDCANMRDR